MCLYAYQIIFLEAKASCVKYVSVNVAHAFIRQPFKYKIKSTKSTKVLYSCPDKERLPIS